MSVFCPKCDSESFSKGSYYECGFCHHKFKSGEGSLLVGGYWGMFRFNDFWYTKNLHLTADPINLRLPGSTGTGRG